MSRNLKEFRRLERVCLEQAELASTVVEREALFKVAIDCQQAAAEIESKIRLATVECQQRSFLRRLLDFMLVF